jgi:hypothetical protein
VFGGSSISDPRLLSRLILTAELQAKDPTGSTGRACGTNGANREGAYRFLENDRVDPRDIDEGPHQLSAKIVAERPRVLAIQDTTSVALGSHLLREELISAGSPSGFLVHTALMVDGNHGEVIGVGSQLRWLRHGSKKRVRNTPESDKWLLCDSDMRRRLPSSEHVITVADREADIFDLLDVFTTQQHRFVIRAKVNRKLEKNEAHLLDVARNAPIVGKRLICLEQRGAVLSRGIKPARTNQQRREVTTTLQATNVVLASPSKLQSSLQVNVVRVRAPTPIGPASTGSPKSGSQETEWILLTSEPIATFEQVVQIVKDYERRWIIEEFHKCWKTGCRLESRPLESFGCFERLLALTAPIAVRLLQIHSAARSEELHGTVPSSLAANELRCLWSATEKIPFDSRRATAQWSLLAIATLGGWYDSKRTGRVGWQTLWHGWSRFQDRFAGWADAQLDVAEKM